MGKKKAVRRRTAKRRPVACRACPVIRGGSGATASLETAYSAMVADRERRERERMVASHGHTIIDHLHAHVAHHQHVYKITGDLTVGMVAAWMADGIPHVLGHYVYAVIFG